jgi:hypothetical protein
MNEKARAYSFKVKVGHVAANPVTVTMTADAAERRTLAAIWKVPSVEAFSATATLGRWKRDGVRVKGHVAARITQACVVTLEPVEQEIAEDFEAVFVPETSRLARIPLDDAGELFLDPEGPDLPETFTGDSIDVGAVAAEFAALAIDPYPRKEGVVFEPPGGDSPVDDGKVSPFAVLKGRLDKE